jgi:predicted ATPase
MVQRLILRNFRSFKEVDMELRPLNIVVGANASGKTNLVQAFRFLRDIARHGLENAVALQGGAEYLTNLNSPGARECHIEIVFTPHLTLRRVSKERLLPNVKVDEVRHSLTIRAIRKTNSAKIVREQLEVRYIVSEADTANLIITREGGMARMEVSSPTLLDILSPKRPFLAARRRFEIEQHVSLMQLAPLLSRLPPFFYEESIAIYDFSPKLAKQAVPIASHLTLSEDGANLPLIVQQILRSPHERERLLRLLRMVLPYIKQLLVTTPFGQHVSLQIQETYFDRRTLPAALLSDGTVEMVALIVAMFFSPFNPQLLIFEEPDRNLHPGVMSALMALFHEASENTQILITTHNPALVRQAEVSDLLLIERDSEGNSVLKRPADSQSVRIFLEEQLGLDYLLTQNLLGA